MESTKEKILTLFWKIDEDAKGEYLVKILSNDKELSSIDFRNDQNFNNIDVVNNHIIENIKDFDLLEIKKSDEYTENIISKNEIWKNIFKAITSLWISEFEKIKNEFKNISKL